MSCWALTSCTKLCVALAELSAQPSHPPPVQSNKDALFDALHTVVPPTSATQAWLALEVRDAATIAAFLTQVQLANANPGPRCRLVQGSRDVRLLQATTVHGFDVVRVAGPSSIKEVTALATQAVVVVVLKAAQHK